MVEEGKLEVVISSVQFHLENFLERVSKACHYLLINNRYSIRYHQSEDFHSLALESSYTLTPIILSYQIIQGLFFQVYQE